MAVTTQLELVDRLRDTASSHKMVQDVRYGFLTDIDDMPDFTPPTVYIIPAQVNVPRDGIFAYQFQLVCFDMLLPDKSNFEDVISDCTGILVDIYSKLLYIDSNDSWSPQTGTLILPFQERFKDYCAGATMTLTVNIFQDNCTPNLPFN